MFVLDPLTKVVERSGLDFLSISKNVSFCELAGINATRHNGEGFIMSQGEFNDPATGLIRM